MGVPEAGMPAASSKRREELDHVHRLAHDPGAVDDPRPRCHRRRGDAAPRTSVAAGSSVSGQVVMKSEETVSGSVSMTVVKRAAIITWRGPRESRHSESPASRLPTVESQLEPFPASDRDYPNPEARSLVRKPDYTTCDENHHLVAQVPDNRVPSASVQHLDTSRGRDHSLKPHRATCVRYLRALRQGTSEFCVKLDDSGQSISDVLQRIANGVTFGDQLRQQGRRYGVAALGLRGHDKRYLIVHQGLLAFSSSPRQAVASTISRWQEG